MPLGVLTVRSRLKTSLKKDARHKADLLRSAVSATLLAVLAAAGPASAEAIVDVTVPASATRATRPAVTIALRNPSTTIGRYRVTLDRDVQFSGSAVTGSKVDLLVDGKTVKTVVAGRGDRWFGTKVTMPDGDYTFTARAKAPNGTVSTSRPLRVRVAPPALIRLDELEPSEGFSITNVESDWTFERAAAAPAGDINCDGYADLYINRVPPRGKQVPAFVLFGRANGFPQPIRLNHIDALAGFDIVSPKGLGTAQTVQSIDDFDGDGCSDLALFYYSDGSSVPNHTVFLYGRKGGFPDSVNVDTLGALEAFRVSGDFYVDRLAAGDFNADGFSDVALSSPLSRGQGFGNGQGVTHVVFGRARPNEGHADLDALNGENGFRIIGVRGTRSGQALATVDGFGGEAIADLLIGAPDGQAPGRGAQIVFGQSDGFPATVQLVGDPAEGTGAVLGPDKGSKMFGSFASSAGDFNGDGFGDALIGTTDSAEGAYLVFGRNNPPTSAVVTELPAPSTVRLFHRDSYDFDLALTALGDVSGDGRDDIAIGMHSGHAVAGPLWTAGAVFVLNGRKKPIPPEIDLAFLTPDLGTLIVGSADSSGKNRMFGIGETVANAGDINGDGANDILLTVRSVGSESAKFGAIFVVYGKRPDDTSMPMSR